MSFDVRRILREPLLDAIASARARRYPRDAQHLLDALRRPEPVDFEALLERLGAKEKLTLDALMGDGGDLVERGVVAMLGAASIDHDKLQTVARDSISLDTTMEVPGHFSLSGGLHLAQGARLVVYGDLDVASDVALEAGAELVVLGDVLVKDAFEVVGDRARVLAAGALTAANVLRTRAEIFVGRRLKAPLLIADAASGRLLVNHGVDTVVLLAPEHAGVLSGMHAVESMVQTNLEGLEVMAWEEARSSVRALMVEPRLVAHAEVGEFIDAVLERVGARASILARAGSGWIFSPDAAS